MPPDVRGALVSAPGSAPDRALRATWWPLRESGRIPQGRVLRSWTPAGAGLMGVEAHLGPAGAQVLPAVWPGLRGDWSDVVRPTVAEVSELHAALRLVTMVLNRLTD